MRIPNTYSAKYILNSNLNPVGLISETINPQYYRITRTLTTKKNKFLIFTLFTRAQNIR